MRSLHDSLSTIAIVLGLLILCLEFTDASNITRKCPTASVYHLFDLQCRPSDRRHDLERERVLHEIDRRHGRWNKKHTRWSVLEALHGYGRYRDIAGAEIDRFESLYKHVPKEHKKILESTISYNKNFDIARSLLDENTVLTKAIVESARSYYDISRSELNDFIKDFDAQEKKQKENKLKMLRTHTSHALKHMVRDWSIDGHAERDATFPYILNAVARHLDESQDDSPPYNVLVPGAGLGRLAHEIALLDPERTSVTTNEKDDFMNLAYRYITTSHKQHTVHPFLESWSHARTRADIIRPITLTPPSPSPQTDTLLVPGDFTLLFPHSQNTYDCIATLFFIDTARNLLAYLTHIYSLLKPGGIWINAGPLLYGSAPFVQLTLEEVISVAESVGFVVEGREEKEVVYNFNGTALYRNGYVAEFWVGRKRRGGEGGGDGGKRGWLGW